MLETFQLGFRNLQEVWSLVLPPVTLLELKRLARVSVDRFHMPDELWVRIIYDFALAHRLRTLSRTPFVRGAHAAVPGMGSLLCAGSKQRQPRGGRAKVGKACSRL